ncbi:MAG: TetR/AcrR family transcriptional regulator [Kofleriaceae bacterium]
MPPRRPPDERTSRTIIRDEALALFAKRGPDGVTVRDIAAAAHVSPALVVRHFGSKDGLREEIDRHVLQLFERMIAPFTAPDAPSWSAPNAATSIVETLMVQLPQDSKITRYMTRMLLDGSPAGRRLYRRLFEVGRTMLDRLVAAGHVAPGNDPAVRAAFLMANDLAVMVLRDAITDALGVDPLSRAGMQRWAGELLDVYRRGIVPAKPPRRTRPRGRAPREER